MLILYKWDELFGDYLFDGLHCGCECSKKLLEGKSL